MVILGNTLALEEREHWFTPAHILGGWSRKLRRDYALNSAMDAVSAPAPELPTIHIPLPRAPASEQMALF